VEQGKFYLGSSFYWNRDLLP